MVDQHREAPRAGRRSAPAEDSGDTAPRGGRGRKILSPAEIEKLDDDWGAVIEGIVDLDVRATHDRLTRAISSPRSGNLTGSSVAEAICNVQDNLTLASRLKNKARREYELYKLSFEEWLEPHRTACTAALEEENTAKIAADPKAKVKQITERMVDDRVRAVLGDELRIKKQKVLDFQAAAHTLEETVEAWRQRARSLESLALLVRSMGDQPNSEERVDRYERPRAVREDDDRPRRRSYEDRERNDNDDTRTSRRGRERN
jgi:hypothetical protein